MKSRYQKDLNNVLKNRSLVLFSKDDIYSKGDIIDIDIESFEVNSPVAALENYGWSNVKERFTYMWADFGMEIDNSLLTGKSRFVYIIKPVAEGYLVVMAESVSEWTEAYWLEADPNNERDWAYIDEDINDLFNHILKEYVLSLDNKYQKRFLKQL